MNLGEVKMTGELVLEVQGLHKQYSMSTERLEILKNVNLTASSGEFVVVMGPSGSGKTTLISLLGGLDPAFSGAIKVCGQDLSRMSKADRVNLRSAWIGMVFQDHRLLPQLSAIENVEAPLYLQKLGAKERFSRASDALELVHLSGRLKHRPDQLSGGERQRTAIARALVGGAKLLLCDEPTGSLNREMSLQVFELLRDLCRRFGKTVVMATHDQAAVRYADKIVTFENGKLTTEVLNQSSSDATGRDAEDSKAKAAHAATSRP